MTLRTKAGVRNRAIQRLHLLEEGTNVQQETSNEDQRNDSRRNSEQPDEESSKKSTTVGPDVPREREDVRTRSGRLVKRPKRLLDS